MGAGTNYVSLVPQDTITCTLTATNAAGLTTALSAASNGNTICLTQPVDYGTFSGTTKNLTIVSQAGTGAEDPVDNKLKVSLGSGDTGTVTIDGGMDRWDTSEGLNMTDVVITTGAANITFTDFKVDVSAESGNACPFFGRCWVMDPPPMDSNILIDHFVAENAFDDEALFYIDDGASSGDTGITIQNGLFRHMSTDGVKLTGNETVTVRNNRFMDMHGSYDVTGSENHTDGVQMLAGNHVIEGNWLSQCDQCIFSDDGTENNTIRHNLVDEGGQHFITVSADNPGSTHAFNTITSRTQDQSPTFDCATNFAGPASVPDVQNNILQNMATAGTGGGPDCAPTANHHNMLAVGQSTSGVGGSNFTGTQTYVGGSDLDTFDAFGDFCLASGSTGYTGATDGGDVGICGGDYNGSNYGPPTGEGF